MIFTDIELTTDGTTTPDLGILNGDLVVDDGLETSINVSLFTDGRAENQVFRPEDRRGWIGDVFRERDIGSLLWLLEQTRLDQLTLAAAIDRTRKALEWMVEDGLASDVSVSGEISDLNSVSIFIDVTAPDSSGVTRYVKYWRNTIAS